MRGELMVKAQNGADKKDEGKQPAEMPTAEKPTEVSAPPKRGS